jgi:hypothetical protein
MLLAGFDQLIPEDRLSEVMEGGTEQNGLAVERQSGKCLTNSPYKPRRNVMHNYQVSE